MQSIKDGKLDLKAIPEPLVRPGTVLIANACSLISAGTEKMVMDLAQKSLLGKARERPDQVRRVLEKLRNEGVMNTVAQVREKLDEPMPMGYSSAGTVLAVGAGVQNFKPGDRVASNGPHAEVVCVPRNLCARVPDGVPFEHAAFTVLGAIALQGVRLSRLDLGSTALVIGLGLIGQLTVALLRASGVRALATDLDGSKCELALRMGAETASPTLGAAEVEVLTSGLGTDAVIITASTPSNQPMELSVASVRKKGRIVLVGVVGLNLDRRPLYFKEAEFVVSCSYGPGRYDPEYEERGRDYPAAYVRWTEQRNMQAVLDLMASGRLDVAPLISHCFPIERAEEAYALIERGNEPYLGILLEYPDDGGQKGVQERPLQAKVGSGAGNASGRVSVGVVGAGNYARMVVLPQIGKNPSYCPKVLCDAKGLPAAHAAKKWGFEQVATDEKAVFADPDVRAVFLLTPHNEHARQVKEALEAGKSVFVEKPLALSVEEMTAIEDVLPTIAEGGQVLTVGFNRRFSPAARALRTFFEAVKGPITVSVRFNAGPIPADHWTQDDEIGGGRIIGEACHGIDLATYLAGSPPSRVVAESIGGSGAPKVTDDQCFITVRHANGSVSSIAYLAGGDRAFPKERVEVIGGGRIGVIEDFSKVITCAGGKTRVAWKGSQDKGHGAEIEAFAEAVKRGGEWPIPWGDLRAVSLASILAVRSLREGYPFEL